MSAILTLVRMEQLVQKVLQASYAHVLQDGLEQHVMKVITVYISIWKLVYILIVHILHFSLFYVVWCSNGTALVRLEHLISSVFGAMQL